MTSRHRLAVWLQPAQTDFVRDVALACGCDIIAAGSPTRGQSTGIATQLAAAPFDDLRAALPALDADLLWLASAGDFADSPDPADARALSTLHSRGVRVASFDPLPGSILSASARPDPLASAALSAAVRYVSLPRTAPLWSSLTETLVAFGKPRLLLIESWSAPRYAPLGVRLFGSLDLVSSLLGDPDSIDAAYVGPRAASGLHALPTESLRDLTGELAATLRFANESTAVITASDAAGRWNTLVTLISEHGRLRVFDDGWEWLAPDGQKRDESRSRARRGQPRPIDHAVLAAADSLSAILADSAPAIAAPVNLDSILSTAHAALLSARTAQPESPATIRRLAGL